MNRREMFKAFGLGLGAAVVAPQVLKAAARPSEEGPPDSMAAFVTQGGHIHHHGDVYVNGRLRYWDGHRWVALA